MKRILYVFAAALLMAATAPQALAQDSDYLSFGAGYYDILDDEGAGDFRFEYRSGHKYFWEVKPWAGLEATTDGSIWGGVGLLADLPVAEQVYITPSFGVGLYTDGGSDLDLGHPIEFRSQLEVSYEFESLDRLGLSFGHLSNASLDNNNPGTEVLNVYWHMPFSR